MVNALREAQRVLTPSGVLIDVRPVTAPIVVEVVIATQTVWAKTVESYSAPEDVAAADAAVHHAVSRGDEIPYEELEKRRCELGAEGQAARLRCRRPWMLSTYRKK
jgi:hypothetical protein